MPSRDEAMEQRLQRWAQWVTVGDGSGYPCTSPLHPNWSPPANGQRPVMKVGGATDARETDRALRMLSQRLRNTVVVHYCMRLSLRQQALRLQCSEGHVGVRIAEAHARLRQVLHQDVEPTQHSK